MHVKLTNFPPFLSYVYNMHLKTLITQSAPFWGFLINDHFDIKIALDLSLIAHFVSQNGSCDKIMRRQSRFRKKKAAFNAFRVS